MKTLQIYTCIWMLLIVSACTHSSPKQSSVLTPPSIAGQNGKLSVKGIQLVNEQGDPLALKGVSYGWHNWYHQYFNPETVRFFAEEWKCSLVRASIGVGPSGDYSENPALATECAIRVADAAIANGIYVIIDWHSHEIRTEEAKRFFTEMATRYRGVPNVIYEIFNEPVEDSWEAVKAYSIEIIETIRAIEPDNIILVGTPHWDQDIHLAADDPIRGYDNLMYSLHFYSGTHKQELRDRGDYALQKGLPLFVSECGSMEASGDGPINYEEWEAWLAWMDTHRISWAAWSVSDKVETCSMLVPGAAAEGPWKEEEIKEWGKAVREALINSTK